MSTPSTLPNFLTFYNGNPQTITLQFVDGNDLQNGIITPIDDLTVAATLYKNRNMALGQVGTVAASFGTNGSISLVYQASSQGLYSGSIPNTLDEDPKAPYVLVVSASDLSYDADIEYPARVAVRTN